MPEPQYTWPATEPRSSTLVVIICCRSVSNWHSKYLRINSQRPLLETLGGRRAKREGCIDRRGHVRHYGTQSHPRGIPRQEMGSLPRNWRHLSHGYDGRQCRQLHLRQRQLQPGAVRRIGLFYILGRLHDRLLDQIQAYKHVKIATNTDQISFKVAVTSFVVDVTM